MLRARSTAMAGLASETGMGASYKFPLCPQYRIHVQDTEQTLATILGPGYQWIGGAEHMFNLSNTLPTLRNYSPLVCKFLDKVSEFFHACLAAPQEASYLL